MIILKYGKSPLTIYQENKRLDFDINSDIDIKSVRDAFNAMIGHLSTHYAEDVSYWLLKISERNPLVSGLFLDVCYIVLVQKLIKNDKENTVIITNRETLYAYFKPYCKVNFISKSKFFSKRCAVRFIAWLKIVYFLFVWIGRHFIVHCSTKSHISLKVLENTCLIQTWANNGNFRTGQYQEGYYGDLADYLNAHSKQTLIWPILLRGTSIIKVLSVMRKRRDDFLLLENILCWRDYFKAVLLAVIGRKKRYFESATLQYINDNREHVLTLNALLIAHQNYETVSTGNLLYFVGYRLHISGVSKITILQHFENLTPEKGLLLGVRKWLPNAKVVGYFHTSKPQNLLNLEFASTEEYAVAPRPHSVIFNSAIYLNYYRKKFDDMIGENGFAFKQQYLSQAKMTLNYSNAVIFLFSGNRHDINFMVSFLKAYRKIFSQYRLIIKMHPLVPVPTKEFSFLANYEISSESLNECLHKADKIISTYSASLLEAAIAGKMVGFIYDKKQLALNPFDDTGIDDYWVIQSNEDLEAFMSTTPTQNSARNIFNCNESEKNVFLIETE